MNIARAFLFLAASCLAGCGLSPPLASEDRAALDSCRDEVNRTWNVQHRDELSMRSDRDAPYSGATPVPLPSDGLADQYAQHSMLSDCLHQNAGAGATPVTDRAGTAPSASPAGTP